MFAFALYKTLRSSSQPWSNIQPIRAQRRLTMTSIYLYDRAVPQGVLNWRPLFTFGCLSSESCPCKSRVSCTDFFSYRRIANAYLCACLPVCAPNERWGSHSNEWVMRDSAAAVPLYRCRTWYSDSGIGESLSANDGCSGRPGVLMRDLPLNCTALAGYFQCPLL